VKLLNPCEGLAKGEEEETLKTIADAFEKFALTKRPLLQRLLGLFTSPPSLRLVGYHTGAGQRTYYFYCPRKLIFKYAVRKLTFVFPKHIFGLAVIHDPEWKCYRVSLHPGIMAQKHLLLNHAAFEMNEKAGDQLHVPRVVDHFILFSNRKDREAFAKAMKEDGIAMTFSDRDANGKFPLTLSKKHSLDRMWSDIYVFGLCKTAEKHHGEYDGSGSWEVRSKS